MTNLLVRWAITAISLAVAAHFLDGIWFDGADSGQQEIQDKLVPLLLVAAISGAVTAFVKPVVKLLSLPLILLTLGIFLLVINALMLMFTGWLSEQVGIGFHVDGFWPAVGGAIIISLTTWILDALVGED
ncbi:phage holin family protein [Nocardioides panacisoli]|uniref:phage holin family protein n=1 Tax=Nocardioides panacisoli TaxID=627624 RepID=UPI001C63355A|nr:phage holin family protein [Nocardioides panacisoli]QYJ02972.1 phage holin family protein [Nocardioides panacisoli]